MKSAILIINRNDYNNTKECLKTLIENNNNEFNIILLDNNSNDGSCDKLIKEFKLTIFEHSNNLCEKYDIFKRDESFSWFLWWNICIKLNDNYWFTWANNFGMKFAYQNNFDNIMRLNNDTVISKWFIKNANESLLKFPESIITCATVFYPDKDYIRYYWWYLNRFGKAKSFYYNKNINTINKENRYISSLLWAWCYLYYTRNTLKKLWWQDNKYFFNLDDADYTYYANTLWIKTIVDTHTTLMHKSARSVSDKPWLAMYYYIRNVVYFRKKYFPQIKNILIYIYLIIHCLAVLIVFTLKWKRPYSALKNIIIDIYKNKMWRYEWNIFS